MLVIIGPLLRVWAQKRAARLGPPSRSGLCAPVSYGARLSARAGLPASAAAPVEVTSAVGRPARVSLGAEPKLRKMSWARVIRLVTPWVSVTLTAEGDKCKANREFFATERAEAALIAIDVSRPDARPTGAAGRIGLC